jgi:hypothetical protein
MKLYRTAVLALCFGACSFAQTATGFGDGYPGSRINGELLSHRTPNKPRQVAGSAPRVVVFTGDRVIPQFVDGDSWQTAVTLVNLENHGTSFDVLFLDDNGSDFFVPITGQAGPVRGLHISLDTAASITFQTTGLARDLTSGWALLSQTNSDSVGMFAIFRQFNPGGQPQEAVVPSVNQFASHFVLPFDNTFYITGIALANPTTNSVVIPVTIRDETGQIIDTRQFSLGPYGHAAFALPTTWPSTDGIRGNIEFLTSGFGVGALGLRFNGSAFTSLNVLENIAWTIP